MVVFMCMASTLILTAVLLIGLYGYSTMKYIGEIDVEAKIQEARWRTRRSIGNGTYYYIAHFTYQGTPYKQVVTRQKARQIYEEGKIHLYVYEFKKAILNPDLEKFSFQTESDGLSKKRFLKRNLSGFLFGVVLIWALGLMIYYQI